MLRNEAIQRQSHWSYPAYSLAANNLIIIIIMLSFHINAFLKHCYNRKFQFMLKISFFFYYYLTSEIFLTISGDTDHNSFYAPLVQNSCITELRCITYQQDQSLSWTFWSTLRTEIVSGLFVLLWYFNTVLGGWHSNFRDISFSVTPMLPSNIVTACPELSHIINGPLKINLNIVNKQWKFEML